MVPLVEQNVAKLGRYNEVDLDESGNEQIPPCLLLVANWVLKGARKIPGRNNACHAFNNAADVAQQESLREHAANGASLTHPTSSCYFVLAAHT